MAATAFETAAQGGRTAAVKSVVKPAVKSVVKPAAKSSVVKPAVNQLFRRFRNGRARRSDSGRIGSEKGGSNSGRTMAEQRPNGRREKGSAQNFDHSLVKHLFDRSLVKHLFDHSLVKHLFDHSSQRPPETGDKERSRSGQTVVK